MEKNSTTDSLSQEDVVTGAALEALLGDLDRMAPPITVKTEVIEQVEGTVVEATVEALTPNAETVELTADEVKAAKKAVKLEAKAIAKAIAEEKAAERKAAREAAKLAKAVEKAALPAAEPKKPVEKRIFFADKADRIVHRLGAELGSYLVLEVNDAALEGDELKAKQDETLAVIRAMNQKVKNRASLLLDYAAGKSPKLNSVIGTAFKVLAADGKITTGDKGNYIGTLLVKGPHNHRPYSLNSARAMGNNTVNLLKQLKVVTGEKGEYVANSNSLFLAKINGMLGITA